MAEVEPVITHRPPVDSTLTLPPLQGAKYTLRAQIDASKGYYLGLQEAPAQLFKDDILNAALIPALARQRFCANLLGLSAKRYDPATSSVSAHDIHGNLLEGSALPLIAVQVRNHRPLLLKTLPGDTRTLQELQIQTHSIPELASIGEKTLRPLGIRSVKERFRLPDEAHLRAMVIAGAAAEFRNQHEAVLSFILGEQPGKYEHTIIYALVQPGAYFAFSRLSSVESRLAFLFREGQEAADQALPLVRDPLLGICALGEALGFEARILEPRSSPASRRALITPHGLSPEQGLIAFGAPAAQQGEPGQRALIQYARHFLEDLRA